MRAARSDRVSLAGAVRGLGGALEVVLAVVLGAGAVVVLVPDEARSHASAVASEITARRFIARMMIYGATLDNAVL